VFLFKEHNQPGRETMTKPATNQQQKNAPSNRETRDGEMGGTKSPSLLTRLSSFLRPASETKTLTTGLYETDNNFYPGNNMSVLYRDRYDYDRQTILAECLRAWRVNPVARRIVKLYTQFVIGEGMKLESDHKATDEYIQAWWNHPLNGLDAQVMDWCDELTRSGNLFFLCSIDRSSGMLFVRAVPADQVAEIISAPNDILQETAYKPTEQGAPLWPALERTAPQDHFMLHYAVNRPVGVAWGEPDLAPLLPWIGRYSSWLEDRARLNRFRFSWLIVWKRKWNNEAEKKAKSNELAANPPAPGSWLLLDENETVEMPTPNLASREAGEDGLALKKMIALGAGLPTHYLAEPESSTRTTAEAAGTPTFRGLEQTQTMFLNMIRSLASLAVSIRKTSDRRLSITSKVKAVGPDITERDNSSLALAVSRVYPAFSELFDREGIDEHELLRVVYRMAGESQPDNPSPAMKRRPLKPVSPATAPTRKQPDDKGADPTGVDPRDPSEEIR
jgi:hypothetical protein